MNGPKTITPESIIKGRNREKVSKSSLYILGIVVTTSPTCSLYRIVVFPAPSNPNINILRSRDPNSL